MWIAKSVRRILTDHMGIADPSPELIKIMDNLVDRFPYRGECWWFVYGFDEDQIKFLFNAYLKDHELNFYKKDDLLEFFEKAKDISGKDRQELFRRVFEKNEALDSILPEFQKSTFDGELLAEFDGQVTEEKLINWVVGQIMKKYPKTYNPQEIRDAAQKRWFKK